MKVKFKLNPQMHYDVISESQTHYNLSMIGEVPKEELCCYSESEDLPDIVDVYIHIQNNPA
jgi:hypothetical protein